MIEILGWFALVAFINVCISFIFAEQLITLGAKVAVHIYNFIYK